MSEVDYGIVGILLICCAQCRRNHETDLKPGHRMITLYFNQEFDRMINRCGGSGTVWVKLVKTIEYKGKCHGHEGCLTCCSLQEVPLE